MYVYFICAGSQAITGHFLLSSFFFFFSALWFLPNQTSMLSAMVCPSEETDPDLGCVYLVIPSIPPHHCTKVLLLECAEC